MAKITFKGNPVTLVGNEIKAGDKAPDFTVTANDMSQKKLSDYNGKVKILSLFPSIDTEVCAMQTRHFNQEASKLSEDIIVLCISNDLPFAQKRFCAAEGIDRVETLSDYNGNDFSTKYGFLIKELGLLARGIVVIDKNNSVEYVEYVHEVTNEPAYEPAIDAAKRCSLINTENTMDELVKKLQEDAGLTAEQAVVAAQSMKAYLKNKMPEALANKLDDMFNGKKVEYGDILRDKANDLADNGKSALNEMADFVDNIAGKASNKTAELLNKFADFISNNPKK